MRFLRKAGLMFLLCVLFAGKVQAGTPETRGYGTVYAYSELPGAGLHETADFSGESAINPTLIIGQDDRIQVTAPSTFPYSTIAFIDVICECGCGWECSGVIAWKPDMVLTSAHSLICPDHSSPAESLILYFGYEGYTKYLYRYDGSWTACVGNRFADRQYSFQDDWGLILLKENVSELTGCLEMSVDAEKNRKQVLDATVAGYSAGVLYMDHGPLRVMDGEYYQYGMDQEAGASGGPILDEQNRVIGIVIGHMEEEDGTRSNIGYIMNSRIPEAYERMGNLTSENGNGLQWEGENPR